jgi:hypothetical protein
MTTAVNKAGLAVPKAGRPAVKRAVGKKTNPVNSVSSDDDSTSESSLSSSCYIDFSFMRVAEEATIVYAGLQKTSGDTHRCLHSMLDLGNLTVLAGAEWRTEEYKPRLLACGWDPINAKSGQSTRAGWGRMMDGRVQAATFSLWMGSNQGSHAVDHERFWRWSTIYSYMCGERSSVSTLTSRRINYIVLL